MADKRRSGSRGFGANWRSVDVELSGRPRLGAGNQITASIPGEPRTKVGSYGTIGFCSRSWRSMSVAWIEWPWHPQDSG
jgi:hypothetical protein